MMGARGVWTVCTIDFRVRVVRGPQWIVGIVATIAMGRFGASLAALVGSSLYAAVISWHMRGELHYSLSTAAWTGALALLFVPLAWLKGHWSTNVLLLLVASTGYLLCLFRLRLVRVAEVLRFGQLLRPGSTVGTAA
jgi:hypothetical protein